MSYLTKLKKFDAGVVIENRRLKSLYSKVVSESIDDNELAEELDNYLDEEVDVDEGADLKLRPVKGDKFFGEEDVPTPEDSEKEDLGEGAAPEQDLRVVSAAELFGEGDEDDEQPPEEIGEGDSCVKDMLDEFNSLTEEKPAPIEIDDEGGESIEEQEEEVEIEPVDEGFGGDGVTMTPEEFFGGSPAPVAEGEDEEELPPEEVGESGLSEADNTMTIEQFLEKAAADNEASVKPMNEMYSDGEVTEGAEEEEEDEFVEVDDGEEGDAELPPPEEPVTEGGDEEIDPLKSMGLEATYDDEASLTEDSVPHMVDSSEITGSESDASDTVTEKKKDAGEEDAPAEEPPAEEPPAEEPAEEPKEEEPKEEEPAEEPAEEPKEEEPKEDDGESKKKSKKSKKSEKKDDDKDEVEESKKKESEEDEPEEEPEEEPKEEPEEKKDEDEEAEEVDESYSTLEDPNKEDLLPESVIASVKRNKRLFRK